MQCGVWHVGCTHLLGWPVSSLEVSGWSSEGWLGVVRAFFPWWSVEGWFGVVEAIFSCWSGVVGAIFSLLAFSFGPVSGRKRRWRNG